ncbi:hypothetical protein CMI39_00085 [Candidatus Pacearchaeota archaeon]|jgi:hypothetical protein|nr:hypothetical protein [Candidatus Pacearchaeota archaeon]|tara:strand:- start:772 stop:1053 length:282 start_codon:yes stop_codon:yes gene_type:complete
MKIKNIILIIAILIIISFVVIFAKNVSVANAIKEQIIYEEFLVENCDCLEKERIKCFEGYELGDKFCRKGNDVTSSLRACSKYNCSGEIHNLE